MIKLISFLILGFWIVVTPQSNYALDLQDAEPFSSEQLDAVKKLIAEVGEEDYKAIDAAKLYKSNCTMCHGRKGGLGLGGAANLKESTLDRTMQFAMIYYGKGTMQSYKSGMNPAEIVALSAFLDTLRD